ncbi:MAG TPA: GGDEF domain-containing protein, partial [Spirochaetia bacterium]|nr:GGDEF domain-containing protein [Spirochaetia bacterium]
KRIKKLFKGMSLPKDQRIVAVKLPDLGIIFGFQKAGLVSEEDRSLEPIVNTISTVIKELRVERTREKIRRRNELIRDLNMELYKIPMGTLKKKLQMILPKLVKFIDADQIVIFMPESQLNDTLEIMIAFGRFNRQLKEVNLAVAQHVYHTGEEVHLSFQPEQSEQPEQDIPVSLSSDLQRGIETMYTGFFAAPICVDISRKRDILGVLIIGSREIISQDEHYLVFDLMNLISGQIKDELVYERERDLATKDELTKLDNRRSFLRRAEELFKISKRYGKRFSLTMIDIDFFKEVNDSYGHEAGDKALIALANIFRKHVREVDVLGRYGGEEFIMLFPETDMNGAVKISERIRKAVDKMEVPYEDKKIRFTISSGISTFGENSRYHQGVSYQVSMEGGKCTIRMNGKKVASIRLKMEDIEDEKLLERKLSALFKKSLNDEQKRRHIHNLLRRLTSLDGLIGIADGRLYTSKVQGRNRVTSGPW